MKHHRILLIRDNVLRIYGLGEVVEDEMPVRLEEVRRRKEALLVVLAHHARVLHAGALDLDGLAEH